MTPLKLLKEKFGYDAFRLEQEKIIDAVIQRKDTFVLMPTGGGKSLCYQIPALLFDGLTLVISPLIALMKDQVDALRVNGIEAAYLNSTQSYAEQQAILASARDNRLKLLYVAPERLIKYEENDGNRSQGTLSPMMLSLLRMNVSLIAIDEAHCISQWGHDFRPEYIMLARLKEALPHVPVIALTATADQLTRRDIVEKLALRDPQIFISSFNRANIRYLVEDKRNSFDKLVAFLENRREQSGIIYCLSRASTDRFADELNQCGFSALAYHAGMDRDQRTRHQEMFLKDQVRIIVATIAFGMGINKSNVRYVVHMDLPKNIEGYYQETGRAGRDGLDSDALLFFSYGDVSKLKSFAKIDGNEEQTRIAFKKLDQMASYGTLITCRRKFLLRYFDEQSDDYCGNCDICLTKTEQYDGTNVALKVFQAIADLNERFGAGYIIDYLRGSNSSRIYDKHKNLNSYGTGREVVREQWSIIISDLQQHGYIGKASGMYPVLSLTPKAEAVLSGTSKVMLTKSKQLVEDSERKIRYDAELLSRLKQVRANLSERENVPPHVILADSSLVEIATYYPFNKQDFRRISGFGETKIERYGRYFWEVVADHCTVNSLQSRMHLKSEKVQRERTERDSDTKRQTLLLFKKGHAVEKIAVLRGLAVSTIESHLAYYVQTGKVDLDELLESNDIQVIKTAIARSDTSMLSAIRQSLKDEYSFGQIRLVLADMQRMNEYTLK